jgi:anthranilate phosphoribosyltransferase
MDVIRRFAGQVPILGVCLGHQCLGQVYGGRIVRARQVMHGKTSKVFHDERGLFAGVANPFVATRYHSLVIAPDSVPDALEVTAKTWDDEIMGGAGRGPGRHEDAGRGRAVPPGVDHDHRRQAAPGQLPGRGRRCGVSDPIKAALAQVIAGRELGFDDTAAVFGAIMDGAATPAQIGGLLVALRMKGETADELAGAATAMRARAGRRWRCLIRRAPSTPAAPAGTAWAWSTCRPWARSSPLGAGAVVAKHGNRAVSSKAGSADVLEALGVVIDAAPAAVEACLARAGIGFAFAPVFHAATRHAAGPRRELGTRTLFNLLGPLTNPARVAHQVVGVFDKAWCAPMARALGRLGAERAFVVHGDGGVDELAVNGMTWVAEWTGHGVREYAMVPADFGLAGGDPRELAGGDAAANAQILWRVLTGADAVDRGMPTRAVRKAALMTAALALVAIGQATSPKDGAAQAAAALDAGRAAAALEAWIAASRGAP